MKHTPESQRCCLFEARNGTHLDCPKFQWLKTDSKRVMSLKLLVNSFTTEHIVMHSGNGLHVHKHNTAFLRKTVSRSHGSTFWPGSIKETSNKKLRFWLNCVIWLLTIFTTNCSGLKYRINRQRSVAPVNLGFQNPESIFVNMNYIEGSGGTLTSLNYNMLTYGINAKKRTYDDHRQA